jgi:hypothetical protein
MHEKKYDLNATKFRSISFSRGSKPVMFQYVLGDSDNRKTFANHIESIVSNSPGMLGFIKRISTLTRTRRCMWLLSGQAWSMHRACGRLIKRFIRRELSVFNTTL